MPAPPLPNEAGKTPAFLALFTPLMDDATFDQGVQHLESAARAGGWHEADAFLGSVHGGTGDVAHLRAMLSLDKALLAVDPDALATDRAFPAPLGNAHQLTLLLVDRLVSRREADVADADDRPRDLGALTPVALHRSVVELLERFPGWARAHREEGGPERLADEAVALLASFGLVRRDPDGTVVARPALARYRVSAPTGRGSKLAQSEEEP